MGKHLVSSDVSIYVYVYVYIYTYTHTRIYIYIYMARCFPAAFISKVSGGGT